MPIVRPHPQIMNADFNQIFFLRPLQNALIEIWVEDFGKNCDDVKSQIMTTNYEKKFVIRSLV